MYVFLTMLFYLFLRLVPLLFIIVPIVYAFRQSKKMSKTETTTNKKAPFNQTKEEAKKRNVHVSNSTQLKNKSEVKQRNANKQALTNRKAEPMKQSLIENKKVKTKPVRKKTTTSNKNLRFDHQSVVNAMIYKEILDKPKSLREE